ncbi:hypothetical protein MKW94_005757 [Papaver nudicaule]|uniref:pectinesterase n=1 Tax=Papaver nudicaule TaxID=74823 RepID=A0AA41UZ56_PAPNU|nr:hypothetical protein [Papaver nudicaule]
MLFTRQTVELPLVLVFVFICCCLGVDSRAVKGHKNVVCGSSREVVKTIVVDQHGQGNYMKIQDAVNSIPSDNNQWIAINLHPGTYREQVTIARDKSCILLQGNSRDTTSIEWNYYVKTQGGNPFDTATFTSAAEHFVAKNITFKNTYNLEAKGRTVTQAVAVAILGDKSSFYDCNFIGVQDTLADTIGRHYFRNCHIEGAMDFIWGNGQSIYEYCEILVQTYPNPDPHIHVRSVITAQTGRIDGQKTGFVFKSGKLNGVGNPSTVLGRALQSCSSSTVLFKNMAFSIDGAVDIVPERWNNLGDVKRILYAEADNTGLGSKILNRTLKTILSDDQWKYYTDMSFINQDGWLSQQP